MQKQLDTPSPYYEGFTMNNKGRIENSCLPFEITRINKDIFVHIFCFDGLKKKRKRPYVYARYIFWLKCMDKKIENPKKFKIHTETFYV